MNIITWYACSELSAVTFVYACSGGHLNLTVKRVVVCTLGGNIIMLGIILKLIGVARSETVVGNLNDMQSCGVTFTA